MLFFTSVVLKLLVKLDTRKYLWFLLFWFDSLILCISPGHILLQLLSLTKQYIILLLKCVSSIMDLDGELLRYAESQSYRNTIIFLCGSQVICVHADVKQYWHSASHPPAIVLFAGDKTWQYYLHYQYLITFLSSILSNTVQSGLGFLSSRSNI